MNKKTMKEKFILFWILWEITKDFFWAAGCFVKNNMLAFASVLNMLLPYLMYFIGQRVCFNAGNIGIGAEVFIPLGFAIVIYYVRSIANKIGKGITVPVPRKRFTNVDVESGEVSVDQNRVQELLLYVADVEDWLVRKGLLK